MTVAHYLLRHDPEVLAELVESGLIELETLHEIILGETKSETLMQHDHYVRGSNGAIIQVGWRG